MPTSFLLKPNIKFNPFTNKYPSIIQLSPIKPFLPKSLKSFPRLIINPRLTLKCSATSNNKKKTTLIESVSVSTDGPTSITQKEENIYLYSTKAIFITFGALCLLSYLTSCLATFTSYVVRNPPSLVSVIKLQVGFLGSAKSIHKDLNTIGTADKSIRENLTYILKETTLAILRRIDYCISGYSSVDLGINIENSRKRFNWLSIEEDGNFNGDTLVNSKNDEYIVVTLVVAAKGLHIMPKINSSEDLKEALINLGSITTKNTMNVDLLWNPRHENQTLTEREMLEKYSHLRLFK